MPHEMFGDVTLRPPSARSRRSSVVVISLTVHAVVLVALFVVPLLATDTLILPPHFIDYYLPHDVIPVVAAPRPATSSPRHPSIQPADATSRGAAPLEAPNLIGAGSQDDGMGISGIGGPPIAGTIEEMPGGGLVEPAPTPPPKVEPIRAGGAIRAPKKLVDVAPIYPPMALNARVEGLVIIEATIDVHGNVSAVRVLRSQPLLEAAALDAVRQWKFTPTLLNDIPVPIILTVTVNFALH